MCDYYHHYMEGCTYNSSCEICPAKDMDCDFTIDKPERLVDIVEKWAKEHPEKQEQESEKAEHPEESIDLHAIIDELEYRIDKLEKKVSNEALIFREVSKRNQGSHRKLADRIAALEEYHAESMNEQKTDEHGCAAETGEVAPVVHGHWMSWEEMFPEQTPRKKNNLGVFCSVCNSHNDTRRNYCPECGAKMDGGAD